VEVAGDPERPEQRLVEAPERTGDRRGRRRPEELGDEPVREDAEVGPDPAHLLGDGVPRPEPHEPLPRRVDRDRVQHAADEREARDRHVRRRAERLADAPGRRGQGRALAAAVLPRPTPRGLLEAPRLGDVRLAGLERLLRDARLDLAAGALEELGDPGVRGRAHAPGARERGAPPLDGVEDRGRASGAQGRLDVDDREPDAVQRGGGHGVDGPEVGTVVAEERLAAAHGGESPATVPFAEGQPGGDHLALDPDGQGHAVGLGAGRGERRARHVDVAREHRRLGLEHAGRHGHEAGREPGRLLRDLTRTAMDARALGDPVVADEDPQLGLELDELGAQRPLRVRPGDEGLAGRARRPQRGVVAAELEQAARRVDAHVGQVDGGPVPLEQGCGGLERLHCLTDQARLVEDAGPVEKPDRVRCQAGENLLRLAHASQREREVATDEVRVPQVVQGLALDGAVADGGCVRGRGLQVGLGGRHDAGIEVQGAAVEEQHGGVAARLTVEPGLGPVELLARPREVTGPQEEQAPLTLHGDELGGEAAAAAQLLGVVEEPHRGAQVAVRLIAAPGQAEQRAHAQRVRTRGAVAVGRCVAERGEHRPVGAERRTEPPDVVVAVRDGVQLRCPLEIALHAFTVVTRGVISHG
jgi:hypothetical protein